MSYSLLQQSDDFEKTVDSREWRAKRRMEKKGKKE